MTHSNQRLIKFIVYLYIYMYFSFCSATELKSLIGIRMRYELKSTLHEFYIRKLLFEITMNSREFSSQVPMFKNSKNGLMKSNFFWNRT